MAQGGNGNGGPRYLDSQATGHNSSMFGNSQIPNSAQPGQLGDTTSMLGAGGNAIAQMAFNAFNGAGQMNAWAKKHDMIMGPIAQPYNLQDMYRSQAANSVMTRIGDTGQDQDTLRIKGVLRQVYKAQMAGAETQEERDKIQGRLNSMTGADSGMIKKLMGVAEQVGGGQLLEALMPGGSSTKFGMNMVQARLNQNLGGDMPSGESMSQLMDSFEKKFSGGKGGAEDTGFTRGFKRGEFGQIGNALATKGILSSDKDQAITQLGETADALDAVRELIGDPNAGVLKLVDSLEKLTGGGMGRASMKKLVGQVRRRGVLGKDMGLSPNQVMTLTQGAAAQAEAGGMSAMLATEVVENALTATGGMARVLGKDTDPRFGRLSRGDMAKVSARVTLSGLRSNYMTRMGAVMALAEDRGGEFTAGKNATAEQRAKIKELSSMTSTLSEGGNLTEQQSDRMVQLMRDDNLFSTLEAAGVDRGTLGRVMRDRVGVDEQITKHSLHKMTITGQRSEMNDLLERGFVNLGGAMSDITKGKSQEERDAIRKKLTAVWTSGKSGAGAEADLKAAMLAEARKTDANYDEGRVNSTVRSWISGVRRDGGAMMGLRPGQRAENAVLGLYGEAARREVVGIQATTKARADIDDAISSSGIGKSQAGVMGIIRNATNAILKADPEKTDVEKIVLESLGAVSTKDTAEKISKLMGAEGSKFRTLTTDMIDKRKKIADLESQSGDGATAERERIAKIKALNKEYEEAKNSLVKYSHTLNKTLGYLGGEGSRAASSAAGAALREGGAIARDKNASIQQKQAYMDGTLRDSASDANKDKLVAYGKEIGGTKGEAAATSLMNTLQTQMKELDTLREKKGVKQEELDAKVKEMEDTNRKIREFGQGKQGERMYGIKLEEQAKAEAEKKRINAEAVAKKEAKAKEEIEKKPEQVDKNKVDEEDTNKAKKNAAAVDKDKNAQGPETQKRDVTWRNQNGVNLGKGTEIVNK